MCRHLPIPGKISTMGFFFFPLPDAIFMVFVIINAGHLYGSGDSDVTNHKLHRSAFHFQPFNNWMNDPNGLMFHKGYYHLFYQCNPLAPVWSFNISWAHAVSRDLLNWMILDELPLEPDQWYDECGCWSGSATFVSQDKPVMLYTGLKFGESRELEDLVQVQAMAVAADYGDPLLRKWIKIPENPILTAPSGVQQDCFRDPSTAWIGSDGNWRMTVGALMAESENTGMALLYRSSDFVHWHLSEKPLYSLPQSGMLECPDFFPISSSPQKNPQQEKLKHVLKISHFDTLHDHYVVGLYDDATDLFTPNSDIDGGRWRESGIGYRLDYGKYYASKSFYDSSKNRQILMGWVNESSSREADIAKGWASLQGFPRAMWLDEEDENRVLQWPVEEIEQLHKKNVTLNGRTLAMGAVLKVEGLTKASQLDIQVDFALPTDLLTAGSSMELLDAVDDSNVQRICREKGLSRTGVLGPFGLLVLATDDQIENTAVFFYIVYSKSRWVAIVCSDQSRSSLNTDLDKTTYGSFIPISAAQDSEEYLSLRVLVDHSIVETFAQGGKVCVTARVYPTLAVHENAHLFLFNNGSVPIQVLRFVAWDMEGVTITPYLEKHEEERLFGDHVSSFHDSMRQL